MKSIKSTKTTFSNEQTFEGETGDIQYKNMRYHWYLFVGKIIFTKVNAYGGEDVVPFDSEDFYDLYDAFSRRNVV